MLVGFVPTNVFDVTSLLEVVHFWEQDYPRFFKFISLVENVNFGA